VVWCEMKCYMHPSVEAACTCAECGKGICDACEIEVGGKVLCRPCTEKLAARTSVVNAVTPPNLDQVNITGKPPEKKSPLLALILSFLIPGLGQFYVGKNKNGIVLVIAAVILWVFIVASSAARSDTSSSTNSLACCVCIFFLGYLAVWIYGMFDAYQTAEKTNKGHPVVDKLF
jgi:hypothetical protein